MATPHVWLDSTLSKSPLMPFNCTICPRNGPKRRQKAPKAAQCAPTPRNQARAVSWATWLKNRILKAPSPPDNPSLFVVSKPQKSPNEPPRPPYQWSLGGAGGQPGPHTGGVHQGPRGGKNLFFPMLVLDHLGCSNRCFSPVLSPWWRVLGHGKSQNALKMGRFGTQKWVKNGSKTCFSKSDLGPSGVHEQVF